MHAGVLPNTTHQNPGNIFERPVRGLLETYPYYQHFEYHSTLIPQQRNHIEAGSFKSIYNFNGRIQHATAIQSLHTLGKWLFDLAAPVQAKTVSTF